VGRLSRCAHSCALLVGVGVLVWLMLRCSGSWQMSINVSLQAPRCTAQVYSLRAALG
jgi:hypothetical protein